LFTSLYVEGVPLESRITTSHNGVELTRDFFDEQGRPVTVESCKQGSAFWVVYTVKSVYSTELEELALSSVFPSGWEIINPRVTGGAPPEWLRKLRVSRGEYMDVRDDRVNWFFDLPAHRRMVFALKINPTFKGAYALPPVVVEAMYSPEFYAHIAGGEVTVK
jgi:uncharacterized protein YfaS (alpha-2-macroglobulin family)